MLGNPLLNLHSLECVKVVWWIVLHTSLPPSHANTELMTTLPFSLINISRSLWVANVVVGLFVHRNIWCCHSHWTTSNHMLWASITKNILPQNGPALSTWILIPRIWTEGCSGALAGFGWHMEHFPLLHKLIYFTTTNPEYYGFGFSLDISLASK